MCFRVAMVREKRLNTSNNQRLGSAGEIDARCRRMNKSLTKVYVLLFV